MLWFPLPPLVGCKKGARSVKIAKVYLLENKEENASDS